jgi:two-component system nitrate/nitrite response regulator NarL
MSKSITLNHFTIKVMSFTDWIMDLAMALVKELDGAGWYDAAHHGQVGRVGCNRANRRIMPGSPGDLRVLIVAADPLVRAGLASALGDEPGLEVVAQLDPAGAAAEAASLHRAQVVVWDLGWGAEPVRELPDTAAPLILLLSGAHTPRQIWRAGLGGMLPRETETGSLTSALRAAAEGWVVLHPIYARQVMPENLRPEDLVEPLTERETEVLRLLAEGLSNRAIAHRLGISEHTVKFHVNAILGKLGAQSRTEAAMRAASLGLILL